MLRHLPDTRHWGDSSDKCNQIPASRLAAPGKVDCQAPSGLQVCLELSDTCHNLLESLCHR